MSLFGLAKGKKPQAISLNLFNGSQNTSNSHDYSPLSTSQDTIIDDDIPGSSYFGDADAGRHLSSPPSGYKPSAYPTFLTRQTRTRKLPRKWTLLITALVISSITYTICYSIFRPPSYVVLPPELYFDYLNRTAHLHIASQASRSELLQRLDEIKHPRPPSSPVSAPIEAQPESLVPKTIWSSDGKPAPSSWFTKWREAGADPKFLDDAAMEAWVREHWANTDVQRTWDDMPRIILKADLLRYLLILVEGGTWSDMDTVPLMPISEWANGTLPLSSILPSGSGVRSRAVGSMAGNWQRAAQDEQQQQQQQQQQQGEEREPIRAIIGIECDPAEDESLRSWPERLRILPMNRHRPLQFVQWTLHMAPNHPILLDVLRRVMQTSDIYRAAQIEKERARFAEGWGWNEGRGAPEHAGEAGASVSASASAPWQNMGMKWTWQAGGWRLGWDSNNVEEWTGPAMWTDAVISYLYAAAGVRPEHLSGLTHPVQVRDVVIVPSKGFNPMGGIVPGVSRLVHQFRGSWKD